MAGEKTANFKTLSNSKTVEILGFNIKLKNQVTQRYIYSYYHSEGGNIKKVLRGEYNNNTGTFSTPEILKEGLTETISKDDADSMFGSVSLKRMI